MQCEIVAEGKSLFVWSLIGAWIIVPSEEYEYEDYEQYGRYQCGVEWICDEQIESKPIVVLELWGLTIGTDL